ncbi:phospho-sugar mutase [Proteinivorax hydrogeniformans]|uniref:phosphoglucomutase (alpha-D-glucose-1,6-bisphosphate-dependent) n=1 Tax=Proteinivorax hydrogeniformans TaxID=1826727 RepID=A0AAU8HWX7_9FIRM
MDANIKKRYEAWITDPCFDKETIKELKELEGDAKELEDRFYKELEFGTAGLRGIIGAGTNRINKYIVRKATQGLADYIKSKGQGAIARGVVIAHDNRRMSREFTEEAALVLAANGIKTYLFDDLRATPQLSFAIRYLNCISGIVVTASHNPPEYNGYKVYWEDGAQIATEQAEEIIASIAKVNDFGSVKVLEMEEAKSNDLVELLDEQIEDAYMDEIKKQSLRGDIIKKVADEFKVVFTPLHGTGNIPVRRALKEVGFKNVLVVPEQEKPDSEFSTVAYPNPEDKEAFKLAIELAKKEEANLILGTDPDCDRVGAVVRNKEGEFVVLSGNQTGALLVNYMLHSLKEKGQLPENGAIIKTIVTSEMGRDIAASYGVETLNTLTGFKYIGAKIKEFEATKEKQFLLGYEESFGYLAGTHARDKDAVVTSMLICEMAAYYYDRGMNLYDALMELYDEYGYYLEGLKAITLEGKAGLEKIADIMDYFRGCKLEAIGDKKIEVFEDYSTQERVYVDGNKSAEKIDLPKANVVKFMLEDGAWVALRPSGTEPKLKIYVGVKEATYTASKDLLERTMDWMN